MQGAVQTNERLEFLGDAIIAFLVAERLFRTYPHISEGELTRARASLVNGKTLAEIARNLDLGPALILGRGAKSAGGHRLDSILSNTLEAIIGAAYLDGGLDACNSIADRLFDLEAVDVAPWLYQKDHKTRLQEQTQSHLKIAPTYVVLSGPPVDTEFSVEARVNGKVVGTGAGASKSQAEQAAAKMALDALSLQD